MKIEKRTINYRVRYCVIQNDEVIFITWILAEAKRFVSFTNRKKGI